MAQAQLINQPIRKKRSNNRRSNRKTVASTPHRIDAITRASVFQQQEEKREFFYSLIALLMKLGLLTIFSASFVKLGVASHQRVRRNFEISSALEWESERLKRLNRRFDNLFTIGGERRFMNDQDQWIAPNSVRVIWR